MVANKVFEVVLRKDLKVGTKIIDSVWVMKKKSNGTLCGRIYAKGFKQVEGLRKYAQAEGVSLPPPE